MITLEAATKKDAEICLKILSDGRDFQREQGFIQWADGYPDMDCVKTDISKGKGHVLTVEGIIAGYMSIGFSDEPAYLNIDGRWRLDKDYCVVHRMALSKEFRGRGLSGMAFELVESLCKQKNIRYLRIDTHADNKRMQHIIAKNGFVFCGIVMIRGGERLAYDKIL